MGARIRTFDWSKTAVGPIETWPQSLRTAINILLHSGQPMFVWWGPELTHFHNDAYSPLLGSRYATVIGKGGAQLWPEIWDQLIPIVHTVFQGEQVHDKNRMLYQNLLDFAEEKWASVSYSPISTETGTVGGLFCTCHDETNSILDVLQQRRLQAFAELTGGTPLADEPVDMKSPLALEPVNPSGQYQANEQFRRLLEQAPVAICILYGPNHIVDFANERMCQIWNRTTAEIVGKPMFDVLLEARNAGFEEILASVLTTGETFVYSEMPATLIRNGTLETVYVSASYQPMREADGAINSVMAVVTEVTESVLARRKIEESEARFRQLADSMPQIVWTARPDGFLDYFNQRWYEYAGEDRGYGDAGWAYMLHPDDLQRCFDTWAYSLRTGEFYQIEFRLDDPRNPGVYRWFLTRATAIRDGNGLITKWFGTCTDINEQKRLAELLETRVAERTQELSRANHNLERSNTDLQRSNDNLQRFAYVASHDLQEPLRKIQSFGDLLKNQFADQLGEGIGHLERMQIAASRMSGLIKDLLAYSRITTQRESFVAVSLDKVMQGVLTDLDLVLQESGAEVEIASLPVVRGESSQLGQLFQNLLSNAIKFRQADRPLHIRIGCQKIPATQLPDAVKPTSRHDAFYQISVADTGIGFDEKYLDRIFEVFQRLHGRSQYAGTGIGLAIVQKVVENHGGAITANSQPGQGATFWVYLPAL
ncbi:hypothetical protein GCM10027190_03860 [Spirosoma areae]